MRRPFHGFPILKKIIPAMCACTRAGMECYAVLPARILQVYLSNCCALLGPSPWVSLMPCSVLATAFMAEPLNCFTLPLMPFGPAALGPCFALGFCQSAAWARVACRMEIRSMNYCKGKHHAEKHRYTLFHISSWIFYYFFGWKGFIRNSINIQALFNRYHNKSRYSMRQSQFILFHPDRIQCN